MGKYVVLGVQVFEPEAFAHIVEAENEVEATRQIEESFQSSGFNQGSAIEVKQILEFPTA